MSARHLDISKPYPWLRSIYKDSTIIRITGAPEAYQDAPQRFVRISFSELQRLHLRKLQCKLAQHAVKIRFDDSQDADEPKHWEEDLKNYSKSAFQEGTYASLSIEMKTGSMQPTVPAYVSS